MIHCTAATGVLATSVHAEFYDAFLTEEIYSPLIFLQKKGLPQQSPDVYILFCKKIIPEGVGNHDYY